MTTRFSSEVVVFQRPFILDGFGNIEPAGFYSVGIEEEQLNDPSGAPEVWRRLGTSIRLIRHGMTEYVSVDPRALAAALERDTAQSNTSTLEKTAKSRRTIARKLNGFSLRLW